MQVLKSSTFLAHDYFRRQNFLWLQVDLEKKVLRVHGVIMIGAIKLQKELYRLFRPITHLRYIAFTTSSLLSQL